MVHNLFPTEVQDRLKWYVYRLIDPRNGETFYVGKGRGNRVFEHAKGALTADADDDSVDLKRQRILAIEAVGLEVGHVIHRHGIDSEDIAYQIEAAVIDAYPGLSNRAGGHGSGDYGVRHVNEIIAEHRAETFEVDDPLILISIARSLEEGEKSIYDCVRGCWRIALDRAVNFNLVLAHRRGIVVGVFRPKKWLPATPAHFPWLQEAEPGRIGFEGEDAETAIKQKYVGRRVPDKFRAKGAANPVRFVSVNSNGAQLDA